MVVVRSVSEADHPLTRMQKKSASADCRGAFVLKEVIGMDIKATLYELRRLRVAQHHHADLASEYLHRAGQGVTAEQARNIGGTGNCYLTDYADAYETERRLMRENMKRADTLWCEITPLMDGMDFDTRRVVELYYNIAVPREDIPELVKRSAVACDRMMHETLARMESNANR